jgi:hypothetical protein
MLKASKNIYVGQNSKPFKMVLAINVGGRPQCDEDEIADHAQKSGGGAIVNTSSTSDMSAQPPLQSTSPPSTPSRG